MGARRLIRWSYCTIDDQTLSPAKPVLSAIRQNDGTTDESSGTNRRLQNEKDDHRAKVSWCVNLNCDWWIHNLRPGVSFEDSVMRNLRRVLQAWQLAFHSQGPFRIKTYSKSLSALGGTNRRFSSVENRKPSLTPAKLFLRTGRPNPRETVRRHARTC